MARGVKKGGKKKKKKEKAGGRIKVGVSFHSLEKFFIKRIMCFDLLIVSARMSCYRGECSFCVLALSTRLYFAVIITYLDYSKDCLHHLVSLSLSPLSLLDI